MLGAITSARGRRASAAARREAASCCTADVASFGLAAGIPGNPLYSRALAGWFTAALAACTAATRVEAGSFEARGADDVATTVNCLASICEMPPGCGFANGCVDTGAASFGGTLGHSCPVAALPFSVSGSSGLRIAPSELGCVMSPAKSTYHEGGLCLICRCDATLLAAAFFAERRRTSCCLCVFSWPSAGAAGEAAGTTSLSTHVEVRLCETGAAEQFRLLLRGMRWVAD